MSLSPTGPAESGNKQPSAAHDYGAMSEPELLMALRDDGRLWAAAFCQIAKGHGLDIDEGWMTTWFANAIENSWDVRMARSAPDTRPVLDSPLNEQ